MAAGTAAALVPIKSITLRSKSMHVKYLDDEPGPCCIKLLDNLKGIQSGKMEDKFSWCEIVSNVKGFDLSNGAKETNGTVDSLP
jgi:branched-chain amino acid aminotransferase